MSWLRVQTAPRARRHVEPRYEISRFAKGLTDAIVQAESAATVCG